MNRAFSKILILVIIVVLAGGVFFAWQYFGVPEEEKIAVPEEKIMYEEIDASCCEAPPSYKTMKIGLKENSLNGWNTLTIYEYDGDEVGFSINYPSEYKVSYGVTSDAPICEKWLVITFFSPEKREIPSYGEKEMMRIDIDSCIKLGWAATFQEWIDSQKKQLLSRGKRRKHRHR